MKIMIVEDDSINAVLLKEALETTGATIITADNGTAAWEMFNEQRPRIVISDWMLPALNGIELCRKIRESQSPTYTYVIIMTAKSEKEDALAAFDAGADDYLTKPYDIRELQARMHTGRRIIDLEDRHQALQQTLINSRAKFRTLFDALPEEIISVDRDINITSINKAALNVMQAEYADVIGQACCRIADPAEASFSDRTIREMVEEGFTTGRVNTHLDRFRNEDSMETIKERTVVPVIDEAGQVQAITIVSRDITEVHQRNEEIHELNRKLKKVSNELIKKNVKLENTLKNLERTQAQMVQSEKMASIGQLAAGVAHEINNPTGFVSSNLKTLSDYQQDMNQLIGYYQRLKAALKQLPAGQLPAAANDLIAQVESAERDVDIEYIQADVGELIGDCREGMERIKKIVDDLKHFAHPGEDKMKATDINAGIESTLNVVNNELKYKAAVIKELGDVPIVRGYPQQLNQVFMNILVNAAQAIEKSGEIRIVTGTVDGQAQIRISDTGCGISAENIPRIFDPFFTTKEVGKGTGLGMNIAYNIVHKHGGDIRVESQPGKGTTFIIELPVGGMPQNGDAAVSVAPTESA